eukprot:6441536-Amphidinium_carterae.1
MAGLHKRCSIWAYRWENFVKSSATCIEVRAHDDKGGVVQARQVAHKITLIMLMYFRRTVSYGPMKVDDVDVCGVELKASSMSPVVDELLCVKLNVWGFDDKCN